jgi:hypothetical protein
LLKERKRRTPDYKVDLAKVSFSSVLIELRNAFSSVHGFGRQVSSSRYGTASLLGGFETGHVKNN